MQIKEKTKAVMRILAALRQPHPVKFALMMWDTYADYEYDINEVVEMLEWCADVIKPALEERARPVGKE